MKTTGSQAMSRCRLAKIAISVVCLGTTAVSLGENDPGAGGSYWQTSCDRVGEEAWVIRQRRFDVGGGARRFSQEVRGFSVEPSGLTIGFEGYVLLWRAVQRLSVAQVPGASDAYRLTIQRRDGRTIDGGVVELGCWRWIEKTARTFSPTTEIMGSPPWPNGEPPGPWVPGRPTPKPF